MARSPKSKKRSSVVKIDMSGVSSSKRVIPDDDYLLRCTEVNQTESSNGNDQLEFIFEVDDGDFEGAKMYFYCPLTDNSLWKLHGLLTAMGIDVPDDEMELDTDDCVGEKVMGVIQAETWEGVKRSKMMDFYAVEEKAEPKGKSSKKKSSKDDDDEDDGKAKKGKGRASKDDEDEEELTPAQKRKARRDARNAKKGEDEDDSKSSKSKRRSRDDDDEDDAKSSKSKSKAKGKGKAPAKLTADEVQGMDEDELEGVIEKYELEVELDDFKTLRKKAAAVIDALEDADMIEEDDD